MGLFAFSFFFQCNIEIISPIFYIALCHHICQQIFRKLVPNTVWPCHIGPTKLYAEASLIRSLKYLNYFLGVLPIGGLGTGFMALIAPGMPGAPWPPPEGPGVTLPELVGVPDLDIGVPGLSCWKGSKYHYCKGNNNTMDFSDVPSNL